MHRVSRWVLAVVLSSLHAGTAFAEPEPARTTQPPAEAARPASDADEERAFELEMRRYERLAEFTRRLVREREEREFEEALERHRRFAELTRRLTDEAARRVEQAFDAAVTLYVEKLELTRELSEQNRVEPATPAPASGW